MKTLTQPIRIAIVEDSEFYNFLITEQVKSCTDAIALDSGQEFEIESYADANDFIQHLKKDTAIVFTDYYLGNGQTADEVITETKEKCDECKVVVLSQTQNMDTSVTSIANGAVKFIRKDKQTLHKTCFLLKELLQQRASL